MTSSFASASRAVVWISWRASWAPVQNDRDRRDCGAFGWNIEQEPLAVGGNGGLLLVRDADFQDAGGKQFQRWGSLEGLAVRSGFNGNGHQLAVGCDVEEHFPVT